MSTQKAIVKFILSAKSNIAEWVSSHRLLSAGIAVELVAIIYIFLISNASIANAITLATTHQPERVTELYFTDYQSIPKKVAAGTTNLVSFTVVNHESRPVNYHYEAWITINGQASMLTSGTVSLKDAQNAATIVRFQPTVAGETYQLAIKLTNVHQEINVRIQS